MRFFFVLITAILIYETTISADSPSTLPRFHTKPSLLITTNQLNGSVLTGLKTVGFIPIFKKKRLQRDSLITFIESNWKNSRQLIEQDKYSEATRTLQNILSDIETYNMYCRKNRKAVRVYSDTINLLLDNCRYIESILPKIRVVTSWSDSIPDNEYDLTLLNRHTVLNLRDKCKNAINEEISATPLKRGAIRFGFRKTILKLNRLDTLFSSVYDQEKNNFSIKCKFNYNRAVESKDTMQIRNFVNDCDYYQVDKEWCTRARMILAGIDNTTSVAANEEITEKLTEKDRMKIHYQQAMVSRRIDLLEEYVEKYGKKRISRSESKIDSVKLLLKIVKKEIEQETVYNKNFPLFANADLSNLQVNIKGLSELSQRTFKEAIDKNQNLLKEVPAIRFPVNLQIDYTSSHPMLFLNAHINTQKDIQITRSDSSCVYFFQGLPKLMRFLNTIKKAASETVSDNITTQKILLAAYVVRLYKNNDDYITFYGKENNSDTQMSKEFLFYDFFDITVEDQKDVRIANQPSESITINESDRESPKYILGKLFFEK